MAQGTLDDPMTLAEALINPRIMPGHRMWLRRGVYRGAFAAAIAGTPEAPIIIQPYNDETVIVAGSLTVPDTVDASATFTHDDQPVGWQDWTTTGGEGGTVYTVTNLNDSGPGSLREALAAEGPRIVGFAVSGTVELASDKLVIANPFVTVRGETSPDGICIKNGHLVISDTHDVIVRHLRIRPGPDVYAPSSGDCIYIDAASQRVLVENCSLSWATDECAASRGQQVTFRYCIISEGLSNSTHSEGEHSKGVFASYEADYFQLDHCLIAHHYDRAPAVGGKGRVYNNVFYNNAWGYTEVYWRPSFVDYLNNTFRAGADTQSDRSKKTAIRLKTTNPYYGQSRVYADGNVLDGYHQMWYSDYEALIVVSYALTSTPDDLESAEDAYTNVLANAGAFPRDAVDTRIVNDVINRTGRIIDDPSEVGGWPDLTAE